MTTILCDARLGLLVTDSSVSNGDRVWIGKKCYRWRGQLIAFAGDVNEAEEFLRWYKKGGTGKPPKFTGSQALILSADGLCSYNVATTPERILNGIEAIGSGAKAAMCAYEALGWQDPARAVSIVCKHDANSRAPVRTYKL